MPASYSVIVRVGGGGGGGGDSKSRAAEREERLLNKPPPIKPLINLGISAINADLDRIGTATGNSEAQYKINLAREMGSDAILVGVGAAAGSATIALATTALKYAIHAYDYSLTVRNENIDASYLREYTGGTRSTLRMEGDAI